MSIGIRKSVILMLAALLSVSGAYAAATTNTIVVTPSTAQSLGWTYTATQYTRSTQSPAACGFSVAPVGAVDLPGYGPGGFYGMTGNVLTTDPADPNYPREDVTNMVLIGTNNYSGIKLSDIKKLYYRAFAVDYTTFDNNHFSRTPWQLHLAITKNSSGTVPIRYLMYRGWDSVVDDSSPTYPYQQRIQAYSGESPWDGNYMRFNGQNCYSGGNGAWVDFTGLNYDSTRPFMGDWDNVVRRYAGGKILAGSGYYPATWIPHNNGGKNATDTCLTFAIGHVGDEKGDVKPNGYFFELKWHDNFNLCAWLDYFVIGYNKNSDPNQYTEDWVYFRPDPPTGTVAMRGDNTYQLQILDKPKGWKSHNVVLYGRVLENPTPKNWIYTIQDDSGKKVRVKITGDPGWGPTAGDYVRVKGVLHRFGFPNAVPDLIADLDDFTWLVPAF